MKVGPIIIGLKKIAENSRLHKRAAEKQAVCDIVRSLLGNEAEISHKPNGAPVAEGLCVSITHSARLAAVAICNPAICPAIGIDAEEERPALLRTRDRYLTDDEKTRVCTLHDHLRAWTIKEAVYKAMDCDGLNMRIIETNAAMDRAIALGRAFAVRHTSIGPTLLTVCCEEKFGHLPTF